MKVTGGIVTLNLVQISTVFKCDVCGFEHHDAIKLLTIFKIPKEYYGN